jgi:hypothetical protein
MRIREARKYRIRGMARNIFLRVNLFYFLVNSTCNSYERSRIKLFIYSLQYTNASFEVAKICVAGKKKSQKYKKRSTLFILGALDRGPKASSDLKPSWRTNLRNTIGR